MKFFDRKFFSFGFVLGVAALIGACAGKTDSADLNAVAADAAIKGYDAVAYFAADSAVKGDRRFEYVWNGAKWYFATEENMKEFQADPASYAPQFGGYCSYAVSEGYTADGDPEAWKIVDGKLYLNYSPKVKQLWEQNEAERIENGKKNWEDFKTKKPEHKR